jgi:hypothetical protein
LATKTPFLGGHFVPERRIFFNQTTHAKQNSPRIGLPPPAHHHRRHVFIAASVLLYLSFASPLAATSETSRGTDAASGDSTSWRDKVDSRVADAAANGETEFIIYMAQQADLSAAKSLQTKEEKGTYVYRTLTAHAEATQAPVISMLAQRGLTYRSFWISNAIWVRGNLDAIEAAASLAEVAAIQPVGKGALKLPPPEESAPARDALNAAEPGLVLVNADDVWAMGIKGQGVVVAGADTGVASRTRHYEINTAAGPALLRPQFMITTGTMRSTSQTGRQNPQILAILAAPLALASLRQFHAMTT